MCVRFVGLLHGGVVGRAAGFPLASSHMMGPPTHIQPLISGSTEIPLPTTSSSSTKLQASAPSSSDTSPPPTSASSSSTNHKVDMRMEALLKACSWRSKLSKVTPPQLPALSQPLQVRGDRLSPSIQQHYPSPIASVSLSPLLISPRDEQVCVCVCVSVPFSSSFFSVCMVYHCLI